MSALSDPKSNKHRRALACIEADRGPRRRRPAGARLVVPATVRIEAGWDRTNPASAAINRLAIEDHFLDRATTNLAARLRAGHGVAMADAHIGAIIHSSQRNDIVILTSDEHDITVVAAEAPVRVQRL